MTETFADANLDFKTLLRELLSSPVVTFWEPTDTWREFGSPVSIARREEFCARIGNRLGVDDLCRLRGGAADPLPVSIQLRLAGLATGLPAHEYARGAVDAVFINESTLFSFSAGERFCDLLASRIVAGPPGESIYEVDDVAGAINEFVHGIIGLDDDDPKAPTMVTLLTEHHDAVVASGQSEAIALRSTFTVACSGPALTSVGL